MAIGKELSELMKVINYNFKDPSVLQNALTHSSYSNEYKAKGLSLPSNERLEFLGDAVLEIFISEYLYDSYTSQNEGKLTVMRQQLVCEKTLARIAEKINLGEYIHLGKGEEDNDCRKRPKVLANTLEALIGAVYVDCKTNESKEYKNVLRELFEDELSASYATAADYKTLLQQFIEKEGSSILEYEVVSEEGPDHDKSYTVIAKVNNNKVGEGIAGKKRDAEMKAAKMALSLFGINP